MGHITAYKFVVEKLERKRLLGIPRRLVRG
jgi:hypothetical protein